MITVMGRLKSFPRGIPTVPTSHSKLELMTVQNAQLQLVILGVRLTLIRFLIWVQWIVQNEGSLILFPTPANVPHGENLLFIILQQTNS